MFPVQIGAQEITPECDRSAPIRLVVSAAEARPEGPRASFSEACVMPFTCAAAARAGSTCRRPVRRRHLNVRNGNAVQQGPECGVGVRKARHLRRSGAGG
jgi:hypothetical protein